MGSLIVTEECMGMRREEEGRVVGVDRVETEVGI